MRRSRGPHPLDVVFESNYRAGARWRSWGRNLWPWVIACSIHLGAWAAAYVERSHRSRDRTLPTYHQDRVSLNPIQIEVLPRPELLADRVETSDLNEPVDSPEVQDSTSKRLKTKQAPAKKGTPSDSEPIDLSAYGSKSFEAISWGPTARGTTAHGTTAHGTTAHGTTAHGTTMVPQANGRGLGNHSTSEFPKQSRGRGMESSPSRRSKLRRPVRLEADQWNCPWPEEAMQADIYKESVVLRVLVRPDGTVEQAHLLEDPGFGFGSTAVQCARKTKFSPALNRKGQAVRALSPAIRVSFVR